ncbi:response regulator [Pedobacter mucosus]|uniref:response regulator n=1 Tax=Pedobacter mucosus TaxID=2895286 RepID=UPI001EE451AE|nr:response regulator [Pedobacter mucosus]UKT63265.1 response regulator [Pedobacter mucosus]
MTDFNRRILILDDDEVTLKMLEILFCKNGYHVKCISDPLSLLKTIPEFKPEILLLDIHLGNYDGREMCQTIKNSESLKHIPILLMSTDIALNSMDGYSHLPEELVNKPFDKEELLNQVFDYIYN